MPRPAAVATRPPIDTDAAVGAMNPLTRITRLVDPKVENRKSPVSGSMKAPSAPVRPLMKFCAGHHRVPACVERSGYHLARSIKGDQDAIGRKGGRRRRDKGDTFGAGSNIRSGRDPSDIKSSVRVGGISRVIPDTRIVRHDLHVAGGLGILREQSRWSRRTIRRRMSTGLSPCQELCFPAWSAPTDLPNIV